MLLCVVEHQGERPTEQCVRRKSPEAGVGRRGPGCRIAPLVRGLGSFLWLINKSQTSSRVCIANVLELFLFCLPAPCSRGVSLPYLLIPMFPFA